MDNNSPYFTDSKINLLIVAAERERERVNLEKTGERINEHVYGREKLELRQLGKWVFFEL